MRLKHYLRGLGIGIVVTVIFSSVYHNGRETELSDEEIISRAKQLGMIEKTTLGDIDTSADSKEPEGTEEPEIPEKPEGTEEPEIPEEPEGTEEPEASEEPEGTEEPEIPEKPEGTEEPEIPEEPEVTDKPEVPVTLEDEEEPAGTGKDEDLPIEGGSKDEENTSTEDNSGNTEADSQTGEDADDNNAQTENQFVTIVVERGDASYTVCKKLVEAGIIENAKDFDSFLSKNGYDKRIRTGSHKVPVGGSYEEIANAIASN